MRTFLTLIVLLSQLHFAVAQDSTKYYIKHLSWQSIFLKINYGTELIVSKDAEKLIANMNDNTAKKVFRAMSHENKIAIAHVILSRMYEPQNSKLMAKYVYYKDTAIAIDYSCNNLSWHFNIKTERYSIDPSAVKMIKAYWKNKLPLLRNKRAKKAKAEN